MKELFSASANLDSNRNGLNNEFIPEIIPLDPETEYVISKNLFIKSFKTKHRVPSQGYCVYDRRFKLKDEYIGKSGPELKQLKADGIEITRTDDFPILAYTGDSVIEGVVHHEDVMNAEILLMECTFLDDQISPAKARKRGHIHIENILEHKEKFKNKHIVLLHFSDRYQKEDVERLIQEKIQDEEFRNRISTLI